MVQAVIDSNILLSVFELNHDFISEIRKDYPDIATISAVVSELERRTDKNGKMAVQLISKSQILVIDFPSLDASETVDSLLLRYCEASGAVLVTQDKELKERAKRKHLKTLGIRQRRYIN